MDFKTQTYDLCRSYVHDNRDTLSLPVSDRILGWIRARDIDRLATARDAFPSAYHSRELLRVLMQIEAFFKKNAAFAEPDRTRHAALDSFDRAESMCRRTNRRLDFYYLHRDRLDPDMQLWMSRAEAYIDRVLGPYEVFISGLPEMIRFTSGASALHRRRDSMPFMKLRKRIDCTPAAKPYINALVKYWGYDGLVKPREILFNRLEVVPKNWKTSRTIACEPSGNIPLQLAFDGYIKGRLRQKTGIDLRYQSRNQNLAYRSSVDDSLSTIDMSMASDTLSYNAVAWLLPTKWFRYLDDIRSPYYLKEGVHTPYAKFSSMGNGATFGLETLIFAAACYAVGSTACSVYGDDIIVDKEHADALLRFLRFLGFIPNTEKSYLHGPFKESCGVNFFAGVDITPFYLRDWDKRKTILSHNVNGLVSVSAPGGRLWNVLKGLVSEWKLPLVPWNEDSMSGVFIDCHSAYSLGIITTKRKRAFRHTQTPHYRALKPSSRRLEVRDSRALFLWYLNRYRSKGEIGYLFLSKDLFFGGRVSDPLSSSESSLVTIPGQKYVRKWVRWTPPAEGAPPHLYWWGEELIREI